MAFSLLRGVVALVLFISLVRTVQTYRSYKPSIAIIIVMKNLLQDAYKKD